MLKRYQAENATVFEAHMVFNASVAAILHSQGQAVESNENPQLIAEWGRRKDGGVMCMNELTCFVNFKEFPESLELQKLMSENSSLRIRPPSGRPLPAGAMVAPQELDQSIARLADEALRKLEAAAAAAKAKH